MPYLIDGNNVMGQIVGWHRDKQGAKRRLIKELAQFIAANRTKVTVVFDGVPDDEFPEGGKFRSVRVLYARPGRDADSRIREMVRKSSHKRDLVVVSSDRALTASVKANGAKVVPSGRFRKMLADAAERMREKPFAQEPVDVDEWLAYFDIESGKEDSGSKR